MPDIITENYLNCFVFFLKVIKDDPAEFDFSVSQQNVLKWNWTRTGAYQEALFRLSAGVIFPPG